MKSKNIIAKLKKSNLAGKGSGGQPIPADNKIRGKKGAKALHQIYSKKTIRLAHENPIVKKVYKDFLTSKEKIHSICHTKYSPKKKRSQNLNIKKTNNL